MKHTINNCPGLADRFRKNTDKQKTMAGVTWPSFVCKKCGKCKSQKGRKQVVNGTSKFGYLCSGCVAA